MTELSPSNKDVAIPTSGTSPQLPKKKRIITAARKEQNRAAQKLFRQRRKERKQSPQDHLSKTEERFCTNASCCLHSETSKCRYNPSEPVASLQDDVTQSYSSGLGLPRQPQQLPLNTSSAVSIQDVPPGPSQRLAYNATDDAFDVIEHETQLPIIPLSETQALGLDQLLAGRDLVTESSMDDDHISMLDTLSSPSSALIQSAMFDINGFSSFPLGHGSWLTQDSNTRSGTDTDDQAAEGDISTFNLLFSANLYANALEFTPVTIMRACFVNALCLGFDLARLGAIDLTYQSPFYRPLAAVGADPELLLADARLSVAAAPANLQPTMAQVLIPHHAGMDLIPLPELRERAILMCAALPSLFNLWEFKGDVYQRSALTCWRYDRRNGAGCAGDFQPWEVRSWEAAPWFLRKWKVLTDGEGGDLGRQSACWQTVRSQLAVKE